MHVFRDAIRGLRVSHNPFTADATIAAQHNTLESAIGAELRASAAALIGGRSALNSNMGGVLSAAGSQSLVARFKLPDIRMLMLLLLTSAKGYARPPISNFHVGAVGLEAGTGNLVLGGNVEFPGTHLAFTLHGEGFVFTRAMSRGTEISVIAIGEAHPCAHCRQYLSEFAATRQLELIDPLGHTLTMAQLYPWPFDPDYLGETGAVPGSIYWPNLATGLTLDAATAARLVSAGRRAYAPYSKCPGAVVVDLADGASVTGLSVESVAFNPTIQPIQAAMVDLLAHGYTYSDITRITFGTVRDGAVDYARSTAELAARIAPNAELIITGWSAI
jgi:cytidine deaminase